MISIVIPVHNRLGFTRQCLACLSAQTYRDFQVIVVDDGSTDGTGEMIHQEFPEVIVLRGDGNLWWAEATNWGIRYAQQHQDKRQSNFVLTLNDDTYVKPDYLQTLLDTYQTHKPCLVGSVSVDSEQPNKLEYAGTTFDLYVAKGKHLAENYNCDYRELIRQTSFIESDSLPGRGTLIPMRVFDQIGLFDSKNYVHYMADIELSVRARKAGYRLIVSAKSPVSEFVSATNSLVTHSASWKEFWNGFTSFKSPTNLKIRYQFAITHSRTKIIYFLFDISRICAGFLRRKLRPIKPI
jgi:GT2 family glycosyltransferase